MGSIHVVNGFRIRSGVRVSHLCVFDDPPRWIAKASSLRPTDAPVIAIEEPSSNTLVDREYVIKGTVTLRAQVVKSDDLQLFVLSAGQLLGIPKARSLLRMDAGE